MASNLSVPQVKKFPFSFTILSALKIFKFDMRATKGVTFKSMVNLTCE